MAVILALSIIMMVMTIALELHRSERSNMMHAAVGRDRLTLEQMSASGINLAMAMLIKDRMESESDSLQEDWADPEAINAAIAEIPFEKGKLEVKIADEMSKIQINALIQFPQKNQVSASQRQLWQNFAGYMLSLYADKKDNKTDDDEPLAVIDSLIDWLDSGDNDAITGLNGAESDYYEGLEPPYECKNGPFDDLSEVRLVKGITPEIFLGIGGAAGLAQYITVYGIEKTGDEKFTFPGKININTAELPVLAALLGPEAAELAPALIEYREATSGSVYVNDVTRVDWYKNVPGLAGAAIPPDLISVSSSIFRITATASLNDVRVVTTAVIERTKPSETASWQCKVLNWKTE